MAFNKNKTLESALKFLNQGKVAQAIAEYQQILRHDARDQATLMTVGDLYARQGDMPHAIEYFERLAQVYLNDGFNSKAIAIYKKIAKLAPNELAPLERLADLYVQQGVLSEARPLFLQIAESHLKANRAPKAVEVLNRLLEVEPENPRVQMRLAELYNAMGHKKEAAQTYSAYAQRLFDHGDADEAQRLIERALESDPGNAGVLLLKARILASLQKNEEAIAILEKHPEADAGGEVSSLLVDLDLKCGHIEKAADRARNQLVRGSSHFGLLASVTNNLIESGKAREALPLLNELRAPMIEAGEQDKFLRALSNASEKLPGETEPLEMLADFSRHTSDPFHLNSALTQLVDIYATAGDYDRAEQRMEELVERNKGDERLVARLEKLRRRGQEPAPPPVEAPLPELQFVAPEAVPQASATEKAAQKAEAIEVTPPPPLPAPSQPKVAEAPLDDETERYIAQALTDVDLFSSYGLTQKATQLLESVLQRAPRHAPTLERLLDLHLGAGNDQRTVQLARELEQIHREREDTVNAERFAELRSRFEKAAASAAQEAASAAPATPAVQASVDNSPLEEGIRAASLIETQLERSAVQDFEIPLMAIEPGAPSEEEAASAEDAKPQPAARPAPTPRQATNEEVDLSDEWEAMVQEVAEPTRAAAPQASEQAEQGEEERIEIEVPSEQEEASVPDPGPLPVPVEALQEPVVEQTSNEISFEIVEGPTEEAPVPETAAPGNADFELELAAEPTVAQSKASPETTDDFLSELAAEVEGMEAPASQPAALISAASGSAGPAATDATPAPPPPLTADTLGELAEVFQEFRDELGELGDEDLETHYNLGIAYREMGLLDEAIGEFQKVAQAVQKGKPFAYAMNCATLLALTFLDKGEPKIASLWYLRALETPELDHEAILALRYDLGVALDMAGESSAALDSFRQVYAMNIDYRDVAGRIATLQKA